MKRTAHYWSSVIFFMTLVLQACSVSPTSTAVRVGPTPTMLPTPSDPTAARGAALYQRECAACHGINGEGQKDWKIARPDGSFPAPPHDSSGHTWHHPDSELLEIMREGGIIYMSDSQMPGFGDSMSEEELHDILVFLKTL